MSFERTPHHRTTAGHGVAAAADADARSAPQLGVRARRQALTDAYARPCPQLGGGHPLVVVAEAGAHGGGRRGFAEQLLGRLATLTKDNDATPCKVDRRQNRRGLRPSRASGVVTQDTTTAEMGPTLFLPPSTVRFTPCLPACPRIPLCTLSARTTLSVTTKLHHSFGNLKTRTGMCIID